MKSAPIELRIPEARALWIRAQRLDGRAAFGRGPAAVAQAVSHLGYVQIDTINVIERCHHHILYNRIPSYKRADLHRAQTHDKTVFEYWTHALAFVPTADYRYYLGDMRRYKKSPGRWFSTVTPAETRKVRRLLREGPVSIRDITDDDLVEKNHPWASKKPSKKALQLGFYRGDFVVSERQGMLKKYDLAERHFEWREKPCPATGSEYTAYLVERGLRAQGVVSVDSLCHLENSAKKNVLGELERRTRRGGLIEVRLTGADKVRHWLAPSLLESAAPLESEAVHILSPFDPLVIQRKRLRMFFDYEHIFEAYIPKAKRRFGYFTLPVLKGDEIVALLDLKTDRAAQKLLIQNWVWRPRGRSRANRELIENALDRFERFQLAR